MKNTQPHDDERWKLGKDMITSDSILDGVTFDDIILAVHCNSRVLDEDAVWKELTDIIKGRMEDMMYLVGNNMQEILEAAAVGREET